MLELLEQTENKVIGLKQLLRKVEMDAVACVYVAQDAEEHIITQIKKAIQDTAVELQEVSSMQELGRACGINVPAACAALLK